MSSTSDITIQKLAENHYLILAYSSDQIEALDPVLDEIEQALNSNDAMDIALFEKAYDPYDTSQYAYKDAKSVWQKSVIAITEGSDATSELKDLITNKLKDARLSYSEVDTTLATTVAETNAAENSVTHN